ncbi:hypothetical protein FQN57_002981 [Myotisia sp. PD_48]|nr:hypothetical protein FQN57_002981 [Myotisia sp. PD_48]
MPLYSFGSNGSGQLGIGHTDDVSIPSRCLFSSSSDSEGKLVQVAAGGNHTLLLFESGAAFSAGANEMGQCGGEQSTPAAPVGGLSSSLHFCFNRVVISDQNEANRPLMEEGEGRNNSNNDNEKTLIARFSFISATWEASFFVDLTRKNIYVIGAGTKAELGLGPTVTYAPEPVRLVGFPPPDTEIVGISSSMGHTVVVLSNGLAYGWGGARKGQLGAKEIPNKLCWFPVVIDIGHLPIPDPPPIRRVACGREFTVLVVGANEDGAHSIRVIGSDKWNILSDARQNIQKCSTLSTSWHGAYIHTHTGEVLAWGRNDRGQLPPVDLPRLTHLATGSEHVVGAIESRELVAFGWGEHGNCGPETDSQGNVQGRWNKITLNLEGTPQITAVGAGCATSWLMTA